VIDPPTAVAGGCAASVVICACSERRWSVLNEVLAALEQQTVVPHEIVLVIDHNAALLARARAAFLSVRVLAHEGVAGAAGARNTGSLAAEGHVLAFLDDDAVPDTSWLERLLSPFADPAVAVVGGASLPRWEAVRPRWFPPEFDWIVGCSHVGMPSTPTRVRNVWANNMAIRREIFGQLAGFDCAFGPKPGAPRYCEETELCIRLAHTFPEAVLLYHPEAVVRHLVPRERATLGYYLIRSTREGRSKAILTALVGGRAGLRVERAYLRRTLPRALARSLRQLASGEDRLGACGRAAAILGALVATSAAYAGGSVHLRLDRWMVDGREHADGSR